MPVSGDDSDDEDATEHTDILMDSKHAVASPGKSDLEVDEVL